MVYTMNVHRKVSVIFLSNFYHILFSLIHNVKIVNSEVKLMENFEKSKVVHINF